MITEWKRETYNLIDQLLKKYINTNCIDSCHTQTYRFSLLLVLLGILSLLRKLLWICYRNRITTLWFLVIYPLWWKIKGNCKILNGLRTGYDRGGQNDISNAAPTFHPLPLMTNWNFTSGQKLKSELLNDPTDALRSIASHQWHSNMSGLENVPSTSDPMAD